MNPGSKGGKTEQPTKTGAIWLNRKKAHKTPSITHYQINSKMRNNLAMSAREATRPQKAFPALESPNSFFSPILVSLTPLNPVYKLQQPQAASILQSPDPSLFMFSQRCLPAVIKKSKKPLHYTGQIIHWFYRAPHIQCARFPWGRVQDRINTFENVHSKRHYVCHKTQAEYSITTLLSELRTETF